MRSIRVFGSENETIVQRGRDWGHTYDNVFPSTEEGEVHNIPISPVLSPPGFLVRVFSSRVDVFVHKVAAGDYPSAKGPSDIRTLVHGAMHGMWIPDSDSPVSYYDALQDYKIVSSMQVRLPVTEHINRPIGWAHSVDSSKGAFRISHFQRFRSSLYSGLMRTVAQAALGIGRGAEEEDYQHEFKKLSYRITYNQTDGVVYYTPPASEDSGFFADANRPAVIRIDSQRGAVLCGQMLFWDEAYMMTPEIMERTTERERWGMYYERVKKDDPLVLSVIDSFGGIPAADPIFDRDMGKLNYNEVTKQRVDAGLYGEAKFSEVEGWFPMAEEHGWAFSYHRAQASYVVFKHTSSYPKGKRVDLIFSISENKPPHRESDWYSSIGALVHYLVIWVGKGKLDGMAVTAKLRWMSNIRLTQFQREAANMKPEDYDTNESLMERWKKHKVQTGKFSFSVSVNDDVEGYIDNPVGGRYAYPRVHIKYPIHRGMFPGCYTWRLPPEEGTTGPVPGNGIAPVSIFYTKSGGIVQTNIISVPGTKSHVEVDDDATACIVDTSTRVTTAFRGRDPYRDVGTNVYSDFNNEAVETITKSVSRSEMLGDVRAIAHDIMWPAHGWYTRTFSFLKKTVTTSSTNRTQKGSSVVFPKMEREGVFLGHPPWGARSNSKKTSFKFVGVAHPVGGIINRCFWGYWGRHPEFYKCGEISIFGNRCPFATWEWNLQSATPDIVVEITSGGPLPCEHYTGSEEWLTVCEEAENTTLVKPPTYSEEEDLGPDMKAQIRVMASGVPQDVALTEDQKGKEIDGVSFWWSEISPDPWGNIAWIYMANNGWGADYTVAERDMWEKSKPKYYGEGKNDRYPFKDQKTGIVFVGCPIPEDQTNG